VVPPSTGHVDVQVESLIVDLFTGVDGLGYAMESAGLPKGLGQHKTIMFEVDEECRQILQDKRVGPHAKLSDWQGHASMPKGSAEAMSNVEYVSRLLKSFPRLRRVLIAGGSPCQGFSQANPSRTGGVHVESSKVWMFVVAVSTVQSVARSLGMAIQVCFLLENVVMESQWSRAISEMLGVDHVVIPASRVCAAERERSYWSNMSSSELSPVPVDAASVLDAGWRPAWELSSGPQPEARWSTFCRGFPPGQPREYRASFARLPLHAYQVRGLAYRPDCDPTVMERIRAFHKSTMSQVVRKKSLLDPSTKEYQARVELVEFIHCQDGWKALRPLNGRERDRSLGLPEGATALPGVDVTVFDLKWSRLSGNSFPVPVVSHLVSEFVGAMISSRDVRLKQCQPVAMDWSQEKVQAVMRKAASLGNVSH